MFDARLSVRIQLGFIVSFHFIFPVRSIGLAVGPNSDLRFVRRSQRQFDRRQQKIASWRHWIMSPSRSWGRSVTLQYPRMLFLVARKIAWQRAQDRVATVLQFQRTENNAR
ncbi:hypothetical protein EGJ57_16390 [Brucella anthropi]|nr:hypothetical protein EGJ57_16390 [Brucella anthropi]